MKTARLLPSMTFPPISWWLVAMAYEQCELADMENWEKQSYRNRYEIAGPNDVQKLVVPVHKPGDGNGTKATIDLVEVAYEEDWQRVHFKSLESAYRKSPYFAHYSEGVESILFSGEKYIRDLNLKTIRWGAEVLDLQITVNRSMKAFNPVEMSLLREKLSHDRGQKPYIQVFDERHGFLENLSVLDLVFNLGPEAPAYLAEEARRLYSDSE